MLSQLSTMAHGRALRSLIEEEIDGLKDLESINTLEDALGRKMAARTLRRIFSFLEDKKPVDKTPNQYT